MFDLSDAPFLPKTIVHYFSEFANIKRVLWWQLPIKSLKVLGIKPRNSLSLATRDPCPK